MQPLHHDPGAIGVGTAVVANGLRGLAVGTAAGAEVSALAPAGAEEVSLQAALAFATEGMQMLAINALAQEELSRTGAAYVEASGVYDATDSSGAAVFA
ncbi:putative PE family protein PE35 [Mycolicibacterium madagascariense]|uniref:Putative PE family protein PE35 n=1 Tax=Mycolicibacterium madagascariense TaxID=212765 RepID=A0A7I7XPB7_9MYCO|nr:PE family protein [Mycolicibacterium madagascariense]MCV7014051.1 PE family protein [Mycolicibacterium madagascariense]BBZ31076.1 putative PE family protein PE35 [Mycolicibacterium madagascariense]